MQNVSDIFHFINATHSFGLKRFGILLINAMKWSYHILHCERSESKNIYLS